MTAADLAIIGLARSGKTTVFNLLTGGHAETGGYGGRLMPNLGVVKLSDERLDRLCAVAKPRKVTHAEVRFVDFPGAGFSGEQGPAPEYLAALGGADGLVHVVRAFANPAVPHPHGSVDPTRDVDLMNGELAFADLAIIERRLHRLEAELRSARPGEREAGERERGLLVRVRERLEESVPIRAQALTLEDGKALGGFGFLTARPLLLLLNLGEEDAGRMAALEEEFRERFGGSRAEVVALPVQVEAELTQLEPQEAAEFRTAFGLAEGGRERLLRAVQRLLGLVAFFTVSEAEGRAWVVPQGTAAAAAAGKVHSDMERGFIRAEVLRWDELLACGGSLAEARRRGVLRSEGRGYVVQDGDVLHVLFNV